MLGHTSPFKHCFECMLLCNHAFAATSMRKTSNEASSNQQILIILDVANQLRSVGDELVRSHQERRTMYLYKVLSSALVTLCVRIFSLLMKDPA